MTPFGEPPLLLAFLQLANSGEPGDFIDVLGDQPTLEVRPLRLIPILALRLNDAPLLSIVLR